MKRARRLAVIVFGNLAVLIGLFLAMEFVLHRIYGSANPFLEHGENKIRTRDPLYTHTLRPNFDGYDAWGSTQLRMFTNSLGFKDGSARHIPPVSDRKRVVFIGDSFTEGVGVPYEQTFVGRFAQAFPELDVLNAGVSTYAPSVYYEKLKHYLDAGLKFDEAIVYIDISDIQDEGIFYKYDEKGVLQLGVFDHEPEKCLPIPRQLVPPVERGWIEKRLFAVEFLANVRHARQAAAANERASLEDLAQSGSVYSRDWGRASWTYNTNATCFGPGGVDGAIAKAKRQMDRLHEVLSAHGVALSVGVYPWPQQLLYGDENSRQAQVWREWCAGKCKQFFDHFPAFFGYKEKNPDYVRQLFFWADVHFNPRGNELLAEDLIAKYRR